MLDCMPEVCFFLKVGRKAVEFDSSILACIYVLGLMEPAIW